LRVWGGWRGHPLPCQELDGGRSECLLEMKRQCRRVRGFLVICDAIPRLKVRGQRGRVGGFVKGIRESHAGSGKSWLREVPSNQKRMKRKYLASEAWGHRRYCQEVCGSRKKQRKPEPLKDKRKGPQTLSTPTSSRKPSRELGREQLPAPSMKRDLMGSGRKKGNHAKGKRSNGWD